MRAANGFLAATLALVLLFGGIFHASVAHDHGEAAHASHSHQEESPQWASLHSSLRHEDKKDLLFLVLIALGMLALAPLAVPPRLEAAPAPVLRALYVVEESRRGIAAYRRFG